MRKEYRKAIARWHDDGCPAYGCGVGLATVASYTNGKRLKRAIAELCWHLNRASYAFSLSLDSDACETRQDHRRAARRIAETIGAAID